MGGGPITVPLTRGLVALVDPEDAYLVLSYKWHAQPGPGGQLWYAVRKSGGRRVYMHHVICLPPPGLTVDHISSDGLDNRRMNLRWATQQEQTRNRRPQRNARSRYKGVMWKKNSRLRAGGYWYARIKPNGHGIERSAASELEAARIYNNLASEHFGQFAWLNPLPAEEN